MVKTYKTVDGEFITVDSDGHVLNAAGEPTDEIYNTYYMKANQRKPIREYYWYNDLQGRFIQDTRRPPDYRGKPRIYVKEIIERGPDNRIVSHLLVYHGKELLAKTKVNSPEYTIDDDGNRNDENLRMEVYKTANELLNKRIRVPTKNGGSEKELIGTWRYYKIDEPYKTFRKSKKIIPKSRKFTIKPKKVVKQVICKCKRK